MIPLGLFAAPPAAAVDSNPLLVKEASIGTIFNGAPSNSVATCTFDSATSAGNLLIMVVGGDKNAGLITPQNGPWNSIMNHLSTSVSLGFFWKVSTGESSVSTIIQTSPQTGHTVWAAEYADPNGSNWQVSASATNPTTEAYATTWDSGTTGAASAAGMALAPFAIDSDGTVSTLNWSNGFSTRLNTQPLTLDGNNGRAGLRIGEKRGILLGDIVNTTISGVGNDQWSGAVAVFSKV